MTNGQILKKAIEKAQQKGFELKDDNDIVVIEHDQLGQPTGRIFGYQTIIFNHNFAKAFWGDKRVCVYCDEGEITEKHDAEYQESWEECENCGTNDMIPMARWQIHLQKMVLEEDPLKYLESYLKEDYA